MYTNEDFFARIGRVSLLFATLDFYTSEILARLQSGSSLPFKDTDTLGRKLKVMADLGSIGPEYQDLLAQLQAHLPTALAIAAERNRFIHDLWVFDAPLVAAGRIRRVRPRFEKGKPGEWRELTIADLDSFGDQLLAIQ